GRLTETGALMRGLSLPVRLAHMVAVAADTSAAAELAVLLTERGLGGPSIDLDQRLSRFRTDRSPRAQAARQMAQRIVQSLTVSPRAASASVTDHRISTFEGASPPTPSRFAGHLSPGRRGRGSQAEKAQALRQRI